ncbi:MAG: ATP synthase F1 subunit delta [Phycisphaerales bacterium]|jgi:F-type H+-transporting ATPase subunit delta
MPLIESEVNAVANVYAKSLCQLAESKGGRAAIESCLEELQSILEIARSDAKFGEFLSSRAVSSTDRAKSIEKIFKGRVSDTTLNFILVLNDKGRLANLPSIVEAFDKAVQDKFGRIEVDVFTAEAITDDLKTTLSTKLKNVLGKEVVLHSYIDASMIGGVKLRVGDQLIDGSVAMQLRAMRDRIDNQGGSQLRARISNIIA